MPPRALWRMQSRSVGSCKLAARGEREDAPGVFRDLHGAIYEDDPDLDVQRGEDGRLVPTHSNTSTAYFRYLLTKPTKYDRLFALEALNKRKAPRSLGCANLVGDLPFHILVKAAAVRMIWRG